MTEFEILHLSNQIFINNAIYTIAVILMTALAFYLIRRANELNSPTYGKAILTFFCTFPLYFGIEVASYFSMNQKNTSFQLSELKEAGVELSTVAESYITNIGYTAADGPASLTPELPYIVMYATIGIMFLASLWVKTPEKS
jgi:hypothetical protein|tara:strand:+ start:157 stop:582 length:426 start_codon:yes stop_codon:yes gene_type:complete